MTKKKAESTKKGKSGKSGMTPAVAAEGPIPGEVPPGEKEFEGRYPRADHTENPGAVGQAPPAKRPSEIDAFRRVLLMMDIAPEDQLDAIVEYCSQRDIKDLVGLDKDLWDMGVSAVNKRRRFINYWARSMGLSVDPHLQQQYRVMEGPGSPDPPEDRKFGPRKFFVDDDTAGSPRIRMAKPGETALTMKEATDFVRQLRDQTGKSSEPVVLFNEALGRHMPNSASQWVQQNITAAWATAKEYDRAMQANEAPPDAIDTMVEQMSKVEAFRGVITPGGIPAGGHQPGGVLEVVQALKEMSGGRPAWMEDPMVFMQTMKAMNPEPRTDPMVEILKEQNQALREQGQALIGQVNQLRDMVTQNQFDALKQQNQALAQAIQELKTRPNPNEPTALTIMKQGVETLASEAKGMRADMVSLGKDLIMSPGGNIAGTVKGAVGQTQELEALTEELMDLTSGGG